MTAILLTMERKHPPSDSCLFDHPLRPAGGFMRPTMPRTCEAPSIEYAEYDGHAVFSCSICGTERSFLLGFEIQPVSGADALAEDL